MGLDKWQMFLWTCFVSEIVVICMICVRAQPCSCAVCEKYVHNCCKFVLYVDIPKIIFLVFSFCFVLFFSHLSNRPHFFGFVIW